MDERVAALMERAERARGMRVWFTHRWAKPVRRVEMEFVAAGVNSVGETFRALDGSASVTLPIDNPKLPSWVEWAPDAADAERVCAALGYVRRKVA